MTLSDLIDLEAQLARDRDADPVTVEARDRALLSRMPGRAPTRASLLEQWLEGLRENESGQLYPGRTVTAALRWTRAALAVFGLVLGWGAAAAVLQYTGGNPVNVWDFLLLFVGVQLLLFALLLASFLFPVAALGTPFLGLFRGLVAAIYPRIAARIAAPAAATLDSWRVLWHRLRTRRSLYHRVEPWILLGLTQAFGVAFNVGALLGCLRLIVFSDIAFSWSTTLVQLDASRFHALVHGLSAPFRWVWPDADPSLALVEATRYSRLEEAYLLSGGGRAAHPELVGGWWPFLVAALAFYGLLPRCFTLAAASLRTGRLLRKLPLDDAEVSRVLRRLSGPYVDARGAPDASPAAAQRSMPQSSASALAGTRCGLVLWRDAPGRPEMQAAVARQTGCTVASVRAAGGRDYEDGTLDWRRVADGTGSTVIVAEGWEAPDKALLRLLTRIRGALGPRHPILVLLAQIDDHGERPSLLTEVAVWRDALAQLEDPWLGIEALRGAP